eukprot:3449943-Prymnesium_polylepis.1
MAAESIPAMAAESEAPEAVPSADAESTGRERIYSSWTLKQELAESQERKVLQVPRRLREVVRANHERVVDIFKRWDKDSSGLISADEFARGLKESGIHLRDTDVQLLFHFFDMDDSGMIDFYEMHRQLNAGRGDEEPETLRRQKNPAGMPVPLNWQGERGLLELPMACHQFSAPFKPRRLPPGR